MFSRVVQWSAALFVGALLAAGPAKATTVTIAPGDNINFNAADDYQTNVQPPIGSGSPFAFIHNYTFNVATDLDASAFISVQFSPPIIDKPYIENLVLKWIGGPSLTVTDNTGLYQGIGTLAASLAGGFSYVLQVTGTSFNNGRYTLSVFPAEFTGQNPVDPVPLPPALILFGSALIGLTALGRRKRRGASA